MIACSDLIVLGLLTPRPWYVCMGLGRSVKDVRHENVGAYKQVQERSLPGRITTNHLIFTQIFSPSVTTVCWSVETVLPCISAHMVVKTYDESVSKVDFNPCLHNLPSQKQRMPFHPWELDTLIKLAQTLRPKLKGAIPGSS